MNIDTFNQQYAASYNGATPVEIDIARNVYYNALKNINNFCLLGRINTMDQIIGRMQNDNRFLETANGQNTFYVTNAGQNGNVLREQNWTIGINDAWVLGGINAGSTFNFVGEFTNINDFVNRYILAENNTPHGLFTVTAREIIGLIQAGYTHALGRNGELVFTSPNVANTQFDFLAYHRVIPAQLSDFDTTITQIETYFGIN